MMKKKKGGEGGGMDELVSISEAARMRGVTPQAIDDLIARGKLTAVEVAGRRLLYRGDVDAYKPSKAGRPRKSE